MFIRHYVYQVIIVRVRVKVRVRVRVRFRFRVRVRVRFRCLLCSSAWYPNRSKAGIFAKQD